MHELTLKPSELDKIRTSHPGRIPVFITKAVKSDVPDIPKHKYLVPSDISIGNFIFIIRKQILLPPEKALYLFINNTLPPSTMRMGEAYNAYKGSDGALHIVYASESTFG
jgi:GABA(A) receptor-associated protein